MIHENSVAAYNQELPKLSRRAMLVCAWIELNGPSTDRQVMRGMGFTDMNSVRPRITELVEAGLLFEVRSTICPETRKRVRVVGRPIKQLELLEAA